MTDDAKPRVTVLILNWNGEEMLRRFLPEVITTTPRDIAKVTVADNGSDDGSDSLLKTHFSEVGLIKLDQNYGFAEGYNRAIQQVDTEYCILLNSDVAPVEGWIEPLLKFMDGNRDVAACQPKILSVDDPAKFEYAGAAGGFLDRHGYPYCRGRIFSTVETDNGQYDSTVYVDWATGAALMVRTELFKQAGGFDPTFFAHMEEIDLCWRLRRMGYKIAAVPASAVRHLGGGTLSASNPQKTYLNFRNNLLLLQKNMPQAYRSSTLFKRRLLDTLAWGKSLVTGKWRHARAILRAHSDFRKMRHDYGSDNAASSTAQKDKEKACNPLACKPNIITDYYLKRRHTFDRLKYTR